MGFFNEYWRRPRQTEAERDEEHFNAVFQRLTADTPQAAYHRPNHKRASVGDADESARAYYNAYYLI